MTAIPFIKMAGSGNDFILVDTLAHRRLGRLSQHWPAISRSLCDRHAGIGADGLLVLEPTRGADVRMRVFNPDGTEAGMCGNGARCVAAYAAAVADGRGHGHGQPRPVTIETKAGRLSASVLAAQVSIRLPQPSELRLSFSVDVEGKRLAIGFVNTGVPHAVVPVASLDRIDVERLGRAIRLHPLFAPQGTNVNFIQPDGKPPHRLWVRTYERGVEHETLACGTGAVASAIIHVLNRTGRIMSRGKALAARTHQVDIQVRSGEVLRVSFAVVPQPAGLSVTDVVLTGQARQIFSGSVEWSPHLPEAALR